MAFNPMIMDASILDVSSCLSAEQKVDVLLHAMEKIHFDLLVFLPVLLFTT
jgi:hypothetical protein